MKVDMVVMRHSASGAPHFLAKHIPAAIINAGDGINEHPTQALLDAFSIKEKIGNAGREERSQSLAISCTAVLPKAIFIFSRKWEPK